MQALIRKPIKEEKYMKRTLSIVLALVLVFALFACPVMAAKDGSGGGNGEKQLTVEKVTVGDKDLKDAEVAPSGEIKVVFSNGMDKNKDDNIKAITIADAEVKVAAGEDNKTFVVTYKDLKAGTYKLVIAKTAKANNDSTLKEDYVVEFKVKEAEKPHEETCPSKDFKDVPTKVDNWMHLPIDYVLEKGYMVGMSKTEFGINTKVSRAMVVQVLYAKHDKPKVEKKAGFEDVTDKDWFADAVSWAAANGITKGYSDKKFGPNDPVTREQLALMLKKYAEFKKLDVKAAGDLSKFNDKDKVSTWAVDGVKWAVGAGVIAGTEKGNIEPTASATRAQFAVMMKAFDEKVDVEKEPAEDEEPEESPKPSESPAPSESPEPSESPAPSESATPSESPATSESPAPSATPAPSETPAA